MIFKSEKVSSHWDTWIYYHDNQYYLYYLAANKENWDGFGVATSEDGIRWKDYGQAVHASEKMVFFLGTGMVWQALKGSTGKQFICNYSEYRRDKKDMYQTILFASSDDLIHWETLGDDYIFPVDTDNYRYYKDDGGRWDCIWPLRKRGGGYWGYWTAGPIGRPGFGFGTSEDGLRWKALPPPIIDWGDRKPLDHLEVGAVWKYGNTYFLMVGDYIEKGMFMLTGSQPEGPFTPAISNYQILKSMDFMHVYFSRFASIPGATLANHHAITRKKKYDKAVTYLSPLKQVEVDNKGVLRLRWWTGNDPLKGQPITRLDETACGRGLVIEGSIEKGGSVTLSYRDRKHVKITLETDNTSRIVTGDTVQADVDRSIEWDNDVPFRLLFRKGMIEFYLNDFHIHCYTFEGEHIDHIEGARVSDMSYSIWPNLQQT